jgi:hypothetical protein
MFFNRLDGNRTPPSKSNCSMNASHKLVAILVSAMALVNSSISAQTYPPPNPSMGPSGTSTMHANAASSGATPYCGPGSGAVTISLQNYNAVFASILMSSDGLLVCVATKWSTEAPCVFLLDPTTLTSLAQMNLPQSTVSFLAGGIYSYLDHQDRLVLVNADGSLLRISHSQQSNGTWQLTTTESVTVGYPDVVGIVPDYQGNVWFATSQGVTPGAGAVIGNYSPSTAQTYAFTLPAGELVANSISSSPAGVAVASTAALYLFRAPSGGGITQVWRQPYDQGPARKPGQLSWGTGSTPAFFGPDSGFEYLTITDNGSPQENMLVYRSIDGSLIGSVPFLTPSLNSGTENATLAVGASLYLTSTYGYQYPPGAATGPSVPTSATFAGGMQRVDVTPGGTGLTTIWQNQAIASAALPRLSTRDNIIYTTTFTATSGEYSFTAIDPTTGNVLSSTSIGTSIEDNTLQMVGTLGPSGVLYQGTKRGLFSVTAMIPPPCSPSCIDIDFIRDHAVNGADLAVMLAQWGAANSATVADLDGNGVVDGHDLALLLAAWGPCTG